MFKASILVLKVPQTLELVLVEATRVASQYPGVFLFSELARLSRPVRNIALDRIEMIGSFEQAYMDIAVTEEEIIEDVS